MSPYLLLGFGMAGFLSVIISQEQIESQIGSQGFLSNIKAVLYGIPLPLCSCGVIPVSTSLKKHGASKGAVISFLVATPQTGVDSIMVTYGMLGLPILIFKLIVALISGLTAGALSNIYDKDEDKKNQDEKCIEECCDDEKGNILKRAFKYGYKTLPQDIGEPLIIGIILSGLIGMLASFDGVQSVITLIPDNNWGSIIKIIIVMCFSIPLYICATASIPLALTLGALLNSPGAAVALLIAGPATNLSTITTTFKIIGRKSTLIYVGTVFLFGFIGGMIADIIGLQFTQGLHDIHHHNIEYGLLSTLSIFILILILFFSLNNNKMIEKKTNTISIKIKGMTCSHCESNVVKALMALNGSKSVIANHKTGEVMIESNNFNYPTIKEEIESLHYEVLSINE